MPSLAALLAVRRDGKEPTSAHKAARTAVSSLVRMAVAMGETLELPLSMFYRYLRHAQIGGGTNEIQKMLIARKLLK